MRRRISRRAARGPGRGERRLRGGAHRVLESAAQPADGAGAFFGGALGVQRAEVGEDGFVAGGAVAGVIDPGYNFRPALGCGHGGVEVVVELAEDGDEAVFVRDAFPGGERRSYS